MKRALLFGLSGLMLVASCSTQVPGQALTGIAITVTTTVSSVATTTATSTITSTATSTKTATSTVTVTGDAAQADAPAGAPADFSDYGDGIAANWAADESYECDPADDSCWGVQIYSKDGCPTGPYVLLTIFANGTDKSGSTETSNNTAIAAGETALVVVGYVGPDVETVTAELTEARCR